MPDLIDSAQETEALNREASISAARNRATGPGPIWIGETPFCRECGDIIPPPRIKAVPGNSFCVHCAEEQEKNI